MDLKALMQKLETINTTQPVMESVETKQVITESVKAPVVIRETTFKSSIARSLAEEFGYDLEEAGPNDPNNTAQVTANDKAIQAGRAAKDAASGQVVGSGTTPAAGAATKPAAAPGAAPAASPANIPIGFSHSPSPSAFMSCCVSVPVAGSKTPPVFPLIPGKSPIACNFWNAAVGSGVPV